MVDSLIRLFESDATTFTTNGLGGLSEALKCEVVEERNGSYELEMEYHISGKRYPDLQLRRIIVAKPNPYSDPQPFRIYEISKPMNGVVTIKAAHISYDMSGYPVGQFSKVYSIDAALANIEKSVLVTQPFTLHTDVISPADYEFENLKPTSMRSLLAGSDDSILGSIDDEEHGEYEFNGYTVFLHQNRGTDRGVTIRYGKNMTDLNQEENCDNIYTAVYPFFAWENNDTNTYRSDDDDEEGEEEVEEVEKPPTIVDLEYSDKSDLPKVVGLDQLKDLAEQAKKNPHDILHIDTNKFPTTNVYSRILTLDITEDWKNEYEYKERDGLFPSEEEIVLLAQKYVEKNKIGVPKVSLTVSFEQLSQSKEYETLAMLENVQLCDTVTVDFPKLGVEATSKCIKTTYDAITNKYVSIELGESENASFSTFSNTVSDQGQALVDQKSFLEKAIENATQLIKGGYGGYVIFHSADYDENGNPKGDSCYRKYPDEILIMDKPDIKTATQVWRWNKNGLGYSKNGYEGPYETAITQDGSIVANFITSGTMLANIIHGGTLTLGGSDNGNGTLVLYDANGNKLITMDKNGIEFFNGAKDYLTKITEDTIDVEYLNAQNITAKDFWSDTLTGKKIIVGGPRNQNDMNPDPGVIEVKNEYGSVLIKMDQNGITFYDEDGENVLTTILNRVINGEYISARMKMDSGKIVAKQAYYINEPNPPSWLAGEENGVQTATGAITKNIKIINNVVTSEYNTIAYRFGRLTDIGFGNDNKGLNFLQFKDTVIGNNLTRAATLCTDTFTVSGELVSNGVITTPELNCKTISSSADNNKLTIDVNSIEIKTIFGLTVNGDGGLTVNGGITCSGNIAPSGNSTSTTGSDGRIEYQGPCVGTPNHRFRTIYAVNTTISTSDRNEKHDINSISESYEELFFHLKPVTYILNGGDRIHLGIVAQDLKSSMDEIGLSDLDVAAYCQDEKMKTVYDDETEEYVEVPDLDEDGNAQYDLGVRYSEFIMLNTHMIQKAYSRIDEQQKQIDELTSQLKEVLSYLKKEDQ